MLSANWDEILSESYTDRKIFKWKDHAVGVLADPFDHTDIQYIQCFSFSLGTWGAISYIPVWSTGREELLWVPGACCSIFVKAKLIKNH